MIKLPRLPKQSVLDIHLPTGVKLYGYTADQMQAYAIAAIEDNQPAAVQNEAVGILRYDYKGRHVQHCIDMLNDDVPDGAPLYTTPPPCCSDKLLQIIAATYQILGVYDAPKNILDVLANPVGATQKEVDAMLPFEQPATERNFCERCGKRLGDIDSIHTCTPPAEKFCDANCVWTDHHPDCKLASGTAMQPLTMTEVEQILHQHNYEVHGDRARYIVRMTEEAHGITTTPLESKL